MDFAKGWNKHGESLLPTELSRQICETEPLLFGWANNPNILLRILVIDLIKMIKLIQLIKFIKMVKMLFIIKITRIILLIKTCPRFFKIYQNKSR